MEKNIDKQVARAALVIVLVILSLFVLFKLLHVITILFVAAFLATALFPLVTLAERQLKSRGLAIAVVMVLFIAVLTGIALLVVPPFFEGIKEFANRSPGWINELQDKSWFRSLDDKYNLGKQLNELSASLPGHSEQFFTTAKGFLTGAAGALVDMIAVVVISIFLLIDGDRFVSWGLSQLKTISRTRAETILLDVNKAVGGYMLGVISVATLGSLTSFVVMLILGIPFAPTLAVVIFLLSFIPLLGAPIAAVVVTLVALTVNFPTVAIIWAIYYLIYQQLENHLIQPLIYKKTVQLHPLLVIIAILIGASQLGIFGALFAIPVAASIQIVIKDVWKHKQSQKEPMELSEEPLGVPEKEEEPKVIDEEDKDKTNHQV